MKGSRKDQIVDTSNLIDRKIFFPKYKGLNLSCVNYITPNKMYKIISIYNGLPQIKDNSGYLIVCPINYGCAHLNGYRWKLAKRTSSKQNKVKLESGRYI